MGFKNQFSKHSTANLIVSRSLGDAYHIVKEIYENLDYFLSFPALFQEKVDALLQIAAEITDTFRKDIQEITQQVIDDFQSSLDADLQSKLQALEDSYAPKIAHMGEALQEMDLKIGVAQTVFADISNINSNVNTLSDEVFTARTQVMNYRAQARDHAEDAYRYFGFTVDVYELIQGISTDFHSLAATLETFRTYPDTLQYWYQQAEPLHAAVVSMHSDVENYFANITNLFGEIQDRHQEVLSAAETVEDNREAVEGYVEEVQLLESKTEAYKNRVEDLVLYGTLFHPNTEFGDIIFDWDLGDLSEKAFEFRDERYAEVKIVSLAFGVSSKDLGLII